MKTNVCALARLGTSSLALLGISILGESALGQVTVVNVSVKRVLGHPIAAQGSATPAAASPLWNLVCTSNGAPCTSAVGCAGSAFDANVIQRANAILVGAGPIPVGEARIQLQLVEFVDLLDPGYPASMFDVDLGIDPFNIPRGKIALETAAELQPGRFGFNPTAINLYLVNSLFSTGTTFSGFCSFPTTALPPGLTAQNDDIIFLSGTQFFGPCSTLMTDQIAQLLAHEIGHYFGLFHTFETGVGGVEQPPVCFGGSPNCLTAGDLVCDTAADPNNFAQLQLNYAACPPTSTAFSSVANNVMNNYTKPFALTMLTSGQRQRIAFGGAGSFLNLRNHVFAASVPSTITSVVQTSTTTIVVNGSNLLGPFPGTGTIPQWLVRLGSPLGTGVGTAAVCVSDLPPSGALGLGTGASGTSMTFTFAAPIPPGRHDVCLSRGYVINGTPGGEEVIAVALNALPVAPFIDLDVVSASTGHALLTVGTTVPSQPYVLGLGEFTPTPVVAVTAPYPVLLLVANPTLLLSNATSGPTGVDMSSVFFFGLPAGGFPNGNAHGAQFLELGPGGPVGAVSNALALRIP